MIQSAAKISMDETEQGTVISIYPVLQPWQRVALYVWLAVWVLCGLLAFAGMLPSGTGDQLIYAFVFMVLWACFLFYAARALFWYRRGVEFVRIGAETLDYKRSWGGYGRAQNFQLSNIKQLGLVELHGQTFARAYQDAFWTVGGERIGFEHLGRKVVFGLRLSEGDAKALVKKINKAVEKAK